MRYAFIATPIEGGVFSVYRNLRPGMAARGAELRWVGVRTAFVASNADDLKWAHERRHGQLVGAEGDTDAAQGAALVHHLEAGGYDGVFANVLMSRVEMNALRYLGRDVRRIMVVHSTTPGTYAAARELRDFTDAAVGVSPRVRDDLIARAFAADTTVAIPNGLDLSPYRNLARPEANASSDVGPPTLRVLSLGRIEDASKGSFWLPRILSLARSGKSTDDVRLTVAGDGPNLAELRARFTKAGVLDFVTFLGAVPPADVPALVARHDVLLMPSRYEGFGYTLVEAMAGGCVPVASRVRGSTDFIVEDGRTGFLFPVGDVSAAADLLRSLGADREKLRRTGDAARADATQRFGAEQMASAYLDLMQTVSSRPPRTAPPLPLDRWEYPPGFTGGLRRFAPEWAKKMFRVWRERLR
jgi:glycosyltransferase involved in cell wall biosynthesis